MRRRLLNRAAAVSLVLFAATVILWVRSNRRPDALPHTVRILSPSADPAAPR